VTDHRAGETVRLEEKLAQRHAEVDPRAHGLLLPLLAGEECAIQREELKIRREDLVVHAAEPVLQREARMIRRVGRGALGEEQKIPKQVVRERAPARA
jgi:hypothetical protein